MNLFQSELLTIGVSGAYRDNEDSYKTTHLTDLVTIGLSRLPQNDNN